MSGTFASIGVFNYRLWFLGAAVSNIGTWMQRTAQDWIILTELTHQDAAAVGLSVALQFGPILLLTPLSGLVADLFDRRRILMITQASMGLLGLALACLYLTGLLELWMVYVLSLLLGVASAFDGPARQAFVSELVSREYMSNAIGLNSMSMTVARLVGPAIAGGLTATIGAGWVFLINFATFAATLAALVALRRDELHVERRPPGERPRMRDGIRYVLAHDDLVVVLIGALVFGAIGMNLSIYLSTMASVAFGQGPDAFGLLSSIVAIGSVCGSLLAARRRRPTVWMAALGGLAYGVAAVAAALSPSIWVFGVLITGLGVGSVTILNTSNAYVQLNSPPEVRGRVMAIYMALVLGSSLFGGPLVGWVANAAGPRWALGVGALGGLVPMTVTLVWWVVVRRARFGWDSGRRWRLVIRTRPAGDAS